MRFYHLLIIVVSLLSGLKKASAQTYYKYQERQSQVDYGAIGQDLNNSIQSEIARREALKQYYENLYYETNNEVIRETILTNDFRVDEKIMLLQDETLNSMSQVYGYLLRGSVKPAYYENHMKDVPLNFYRDNQCFVRIARYKSGKLSSLQSDSLIQAFNVNFNRAINSISGIRTGSSSEATVQGLAELNGIPVTVKLSILPNYVANICEGRSPLFFDR